MEQFRFKRKYRRRAGYLVLWILVALAVTGAALLVSGRISV
jgi:hypothetical protein